MADEFFSRTPHPAALRRSGGGAWLIGLGAFVLGAGGVGLLAWEGLLPLHKARPDETAAVAPAPAASSAAPVNPALAVQTGALETRIAALEQRQAQLDLRAEAASGNAARAEGMLIAFAARRALDRGVALGALEDQLRLRFSDSQPNAVSTIIDAGKKPVTLGKLVAGLDALSPRLAAAPASLSTWEKVKHEISNLFVIRHDTSPSPAPENRIDRARISLEAGRIDEAVAEVQSLPGAADAGEWITDARRYDAARKALDQVETAALLDTQRLRDAGGRKVEQPGPAH